MQNFGAGIADTLREEPRLRQNPDLRDKWKMMNELIQNADRIKEFRGRAYYVSTGKWTGIDKNLTAAISAAKALVFSENVFTDFEYKAIDSQTLRQYYTDSTTRVSKKINFRDKIDLPAIPGVDQGWFGLINATEFLKLIVDENGDLRRSLFYDNVRDYQGDTAANRGIKETLNSKVPQNMVILNNGITIIADKAMSLPRSEISLDNYQIVNGAQTSYVMYEFRNLLDETVFLPAKIIATTDPTVSTNITIANNRQTAVKDEDLLALTQVQKDLEEYFATFTDKKQRLYYERRSNQYNNRSDVEKVRIVSLATSLRSYSAMFFGVPHMASRYYGRLFKDYSAKIFDGKKANIAFYTSAFALFKFNFYIRNNQPGFERKFAKFKYFVILMMRLYITGNSGLERSQKETEKECHRINSILWDDRKCKAIMQQMLEVIASVAADKITSNELTSKKFFLDDVLAHVKKLGIYSN